MVATPSHGQRTRGSDASSGHEPDTILIVEDEPTIATAIAQRLSAEGFRIEVAADGYAAVNAAARSHPAAVILDVMLPGIDGLEVCRRIQAERDVPVLMLTARDDETDLLVGLGVGADDYMTKPFSMRELVARLRALLRRAHRGQPAAQQAEPDTAAPLASLEFGDVVIDQAQHRVWRAGQQVHLTPTEFELVATLAASPREVLSRERLLEEVWDWVDASGTRTVDSHIKAVRRKLGADLIRTVHGIGYAFEPPQAGEPPAAQPEGGGL